ncbi:MAG: glycoside hydrolase family 30 protein [Bacteroidaceae bacterium]|nr:glycoside hydrolase family 30 protein [Bacteroidaceae bacterium]
MNNFTNIFLISALLCCMTGQVKAQQVTQFSVTNHQQQTIDGFGASDAWSMWRIGEWEDSLQQQVADWLFSSETFADGSPKGIGLSIWRFNAGAGSATQGDSAQINHDTRTEYFEKQTGQRRFLKLAKERGVPTFLAFYNSPPIHLTQNGLATNTGRGGTFNLKADAYDDFAAYIADMLQAAEREDGIHFDYVCPVNEPDGHWNWLGPKQEGSPATNREIAHIAREMNRVFQQRGITTKILINESSDFRCMYATHETDWQRGYEIQAFWNPDSTDTYVGNLPSIARVMAGHSYWTNTPILRPGERNYERVGLYGYRKRLKEAIETLSPTLPRNGEGAHAESSQKTNIPNGSPLHGGDVREDREGLGFWMTELCIMSNDEEIHGGGGFDFSMEEALYVARVMHYDLTVANARSWQWWRAAGGNYKDGLIRMYVKGERSGGGRGQGRGMVQANMVRDSKLMWTMGNFSRFVRPGAVRLDMEGDMEIDGLMLSAYQNTDGTLAIVAINYSKEDRPVSIDLSQLSTVNYQLSTITAYRTSDVEGESLKNIGKVDLRNTTLPARSVTTFVVEN